MQSPWKGTGLVLGIYAAVTTIVSAGPIIQSQESGARNILQYAPIGQSFTAENTKLSTVGFKIQNSSQVFAGGNAFRYDLLAGEGASGTLLGSSHFTLPDFFFGYADVDMSWANLVVGQKYTILVVAPDLDWSITWNQIAFVPSGIPISGKTNYTGGQAIWSGALQPHADLTFRIQPGAEPPPVPTITCPDPIVAECSGGPVTVSVTVEEEAGNSLQVIWSLGGTALQTNEVSSGLPASVVSFTSSLPLGQHTVAVSVSNGKSAPVSCSTSVTVQDTTAPQIQNLIASPNNLWPVNHFMIPVTITALSTEGCGTATTKIIGVTSSEQRVGPIKFQTDWEITGDMTLDLRAERSGKFRDRIYTITVESEDEVGNKSTRDVVVTVPHD